MGSTRTEIDHEQSFGGADRGGVGGLRVGVGERLARQGYRPGPAADQLRLMADVSGWLAARDLGAGDLTAVAAEQFSAQRRAAGRLRLASTRALCPLLDYLRELGVVPPPAAVAAPSTASEVLLERYADLCGYPHKSAYLTSRKVASPRALRLRRSHSLPISLHA